MAFLAPASRARIQRDLTAWLRGIPAIRAAKVRVERHLRGEDNVGLVNQLPMFAPYSAGAFKERAPLTLLAIQQTFPLLCELLRSTEQALISPVGIEEFCSRYYNPQGIEEIRQLFESYGSDKWSPHNYHLLYGSILHDRTAIRKVLEVGLGTNNEDVVSNMGLEGRPGASLRAFRDFLPNAQVYGADIDRRVLFSEDRIDSTFVDQTDLKTFDQLGQRVGTGLDLIIDDGLHAPNANLAVLIFALERLRVGGWLVIEDIATEAASLWQVVACLIPARYRVALVEAEGALLFVVERLD